MLGYLTDAEKISYDAALQGVFDTFARPFTLYIDAGVAVVNTTATFAGMFGDQSQQVSTTPFTPQVYTLTGCILYGNKQPWEYISPDGRKDEQQNKVRESFGTVRIKVDATGNALLSQCQQLVLDGFTFTLNSNARPHGLVGAPTRWTYTCEKQD